MRPLRNATLLAVASVLVACGQQSPDSGAKATVATAADDPTGLPDGNWQLVSGEAGGAAIDPDPSQPITLRAEGTSWSGWDGCNDYELTFEHADGVDVRPVQLDGEDAGCASASIEETAVRYGTALLRLDGFSTAGDELRLIGDGVALRFAPA